MLLFFIFELMMFQLCLRLECVSESKVFQYINILSMEISQENGIIEA